MKNLFKIMAVASALAAAASCAPKNEAPKVLVLYYSQTSNTRAVAEQIADALKADIEEIIAVNPYDGDFRATIDRCLQEQKDGILPEIEPLKVDVAAYDVIFLGYPVWFGTYAPPVAKWLSEVSLAGKKIVPFCTFGSGGLDSSSAKLAEAQPEAEILPGYGVRAARMAAVPRELDRFLKAGGFVEGEYTAPAEFPEQQPVTEEEAAVFDAAVDGYPMLHCKAVTTASREVPDGTEYLFVAEDLPREGAPADMPPSGPIKVYVLVEEGQAPVFTQVLR
jgi:flavodoxin